MMLLTDDSAFHKLISTQSTSWSTALIQFQSACVNLNPTLTARWVILSKFL